MDPRSYHFPCGAHTRVSFVWYQVFRAYQKVQDKCELFTQKQVVAETKKV